jgi:cytochrome c oxidase assembly protein Cox11
MNKKRNIVTLAVIIAILMLGVGYASVTKTLTINGKLNATVDDTKFVVAFTKVSNSTNIVSDSATVNGLSASFTVDGSKMTTKGDQATVTYEIKNETTEAVNLKAQLSAANIATAENSKFEVTATDLSGETLAPGATTTATITVTLKETPTVAITDEVVTITYTATAVQ